MASNAQLAVTTRQPAVQLSAAAFSVRGRETAFNWMLPLACVAVLRRAAPPTYHCGRYRADLLLSGLQTAAADVGTSHS